MVFWHIWGAGAVSLNESPSEKEGKSSTSHTRQKPSRCLNESPSEKEGKCGGEPRR